MLSSMHIGKYFDGESAKQDFDAFMSNKREEKEIESGRMVLIGDERSELARQGVELERPKSINLNKKVIKKLTQFEIDNELIPVGDKID